MDLVKFLGGFALGATGAALYEAFRADKKMVGMGQGVVGGFSGGPGGGFGGGPGVVSSAGPASGGFGGGPGLVVGPPAGDGGSNFMGPGIVMADDIERGDGQLWPIVSVPPGSALPGSSFFGVSASPWFWPLNLNWLFPQPESPLNMVCRKAKEDGEEVLPCEKTYPLRRTGQAFALGPPAGWL